MMVMAYQDVQERDLSQKYARSLSTFLYSNQRMHTLRALVNIELRQYILINISLHKYCNYVLNSCLTNVQHEAEHHTTTTH